MQEPVLQRIAARHGVTPEQFTLAWLRQQGFAVIPSSTQRANLAANLNVPTLTLSEEEQQAIAGLDRSERIANPDFAPGWY
ncbi:aldo/keto reductase [Pseudogulbenkiania subflava]|uniref:Aldo/keto reductase family protein n=1 Tax=Pseudogulbenkiania subflava DSM 22618 TaxID=1123014 RepID=A0A1Y6BBW4_9NEIS|nr:aldo/keto reductase [Pseudogulbenkiania subflava]SMF03175.1 Aldo/keto reductase family protein [Pseudogulbenkiania subflava DSM 22618]